MMITRDWLDQVSDESGLTKGQQQLLTIWCESVPYVGKLIPDEVAQFIEKCKGWRKTAQEVRALRQSWNF